VLHGRHALSDLCIDSSLLRWDIFFDEGRTGPGEMPTAYFFRNDFVVFSLAAQYPFQANQSHADPNNADLWLYPTWYHCLSDDSPDL
jgi:hypothetical protein